MTENMTGVQTGTVKFFNSEKNYGFIIQNDEGADIFFYASGIMNEKTTTLTKDQKVSYEIREDKKRFEAINVEKIII
jgi:CspA family cold shock protein